MLILKFCNDSSLLSVAVSVFPGGIIFGFYLFYHLFASDDVIKLLWPLISAPVCAVIISCVITIKKRIQEKYTFDNLYYNSVACGFYIVSGLFFLRHSLGKYIMGKMAVDNKFSSIFCKKYHFSRYFFGF